MGDLAAAREFLNWKRSFFMDACRTVDIHTLIDRAGAMTNFYLRVMYQDNINKIDTKRELMGDALEELAQHLQIMNGFQPLDAEVKWPEFVPQNDVETAQYAQTLTGMGVESKQTVAETLGLDWTKEQERLQQEQRVSSNIGAEFLRAFNRNGQAPGENGMQGTMPPMNSPGNMMNQ